MAARKDHKGRILRTGEYYNAKTHIYQYRKMVNGERITVSDADLQELRKKEHELLVKIDQEEKLKNRNRDMTFDEYFNFWFKTYAPFGRKPSTLTTYKNYYELYAKKIIGSKKIGKISKVDIQTIFNNTIAKGLKHNTLKGMKSCLSAVFECAVDDDVVRKNPVKNIDIPAAGKRAKKTLSEDQLNRFMDYVKTNADFKDYYPMFVVLFNTGMRVGELAALTWDDVDFKEGTISINKTLVSLDPKVYGFRYAIGTPKSNTSKRIIPMNPATKKALLQCRPQTFWKRDYSVPMVDDLGRKTGDCKRFVFTTRHNNILTETVVRNRISAIIKKYNESILDDDQKLEYFSPHTTRHTFTSKAYEAGADMKIVSELLGHSSSSITLDIYTHLMDKKQREKEEAVKSIGIL